MQEDKSTVVIKAILNNILSLEPLFEECKNLQLRLEDDAAEQSIESDTEATKTILYKLKDNVDQIYQNFNEHFLNPIGKINLVPLEQLIEPKIFQQHDLVEDDTVVLSSDSEIEQVSNVNKNRSILKNGNSKSPPKKVKFHASSYSSSSSSSQSDDESSDSSFEGKRKLNNNNIRKLKIKRVKKRTYYHHHHPHHQSDPKLKMNCSVVLKKHEIDEDILQTYMNNCESSDMMTSVKRKQFLLDDSSASSSPSANEDDEFNATPTIRKQKRVKLKSPPPRNVVAEDADKTEENGADHSHDKIEDVRENEDLVKNNAAFDKILNKSDKTDANNDENDQSDTTECEISKENESTSQEAENSLDLHENAKENKSDNVENHSDNEKNDLEDDESSKQNDVKKRSGKKKVKRFLSDSEDDSSKENDDKDDFKPNKSSASSSSDDETREAQQADKKKSRRRIRRVKDSSDEEDKDNKEKSTRKQIRKLLQKDSLADTTIRAAKDEQERKARIIERQKKYNNIFDAEKLESTTLSKVVLDFNEETEEEIVKVDKELVKQLKPHQGQGIKFMWEACFESVERARNTDGSGCILAHCMGLGKTLQVITLVHTLLRYQDKTSVNKVMVVCPLSTVLNWVAEFKKWLPDDDVIDVYDLVAYKQNRERLFYVMEWHRNGGVLVLGYDMFRNLSNDANKRVTKKMRNDFQTALVDPGPDLVVCDEGHLLKNEKTSISKSMNRLRTLRRIVLTGTPLQNNLKEYFCMVQFVKPNLLGTYKEYLNRFVNPITNGQYTDSTPQDIQLMRKRSHVLHKLLDGLVERRDYSVLAPFLPPKYEYVLFINLSQTQIKLYDHYLKEFARRPRAGGKSSYLFIDFQEFQRICTHPRVLLDKSRQDREKKDMEEDDEDEDDEGSLKDFIDDGSDGESSDNSSSSGASARSDTVQIKPRRVTRATATEELGPIALLDEPIERPQEWWSQYTAGDELDNIVSSGKLHLLFEILHQCELMGDKVLVFSQSLYSLNIIEYFLGKIDEASQTEDTKLVGGYASSWSLGLDYYRLDGSSSCDNRAAWCKSFNDPDNTRARLFLISTRAGGLGINLVAANRVIIFDVSWNPSHDIQSIYRVYRFGQTKPSYIYRFVTHGTMEMKIYERQVTKQAISKRVIDEQQIDRHYNQNDLAELYKFEPANTSDQPTPLVPKDILLGELLHKNKDLIFKYHEHQSLLENKEDEVLNEEERKAAWDEFENEKQARQYNSGTINNLPIHLVVAAITNITRREYPTLTPTEINGVMTQLLAELRSQIANGDVTMYNKVLEEVALIRAEEKTRLMQYYQQRAQQQQHQMLYQALRDQLGTMNPSNPEANRLLQQYQELARANMHVANTSRHMTSTPTINNAPPPPPAAAPNPIEIVSIDDD